MDTCRELRDARVRTLELAADLDDAQWMGPRIAIVNPMRWEIGHVAWFQEFWTLRRTGAAPLRGDGDALYDSAKVAHDTRWDLALPGRAETLGYMEDVLERCLGAFDPAHPYFHELALFHEDMHGEALTYTRQTLSYPEPRLRGLEAPPDAGPYPGDAEVPGAHYALGAVEGPAFAFDNEKWAHPVEVAPFRMARAAVTHEEYLRFVEAGGYEDRRFWSDEGWTWRTSVGAKHPVYWERAGGEYRLRRYDRLVPLRPHAAIIHVCWFEADAYCRWAGRRLPTEAEWELAASTPEKRPFPWGDAAAHDRANLDGRFGCTVDVGAFPEGDGPYGHRQLFGNVWEWTSSDFQAYPGFVVDPYKEYSAPWFASPHKVLRGGCWATRARLLRNTWRNFYPPHRRDVFGGFRTCAID
jgi:iron(II)-dependent oxidoreductase